MLKRVRVLVSLLVGLVMITGVIALAGSSTAASPRTAAPRATAPCGRRHYPPCPPKPSISVSPQNVRRGHYITVTVSHYPADKRVTVHLAGHGQYIFLGSTTTGRHGNASLSARIPRHIPLGGYTVYVQVGSSTTARHINVIRG